VFLSLSSIARLDGGQVAESFCTARVAVHHAEFIPKVSSLETHKPSRRRWPWHWPKAARRPTPADGRTPRRR
jgi:hypothetical protein